MRAFIHAIATHFCIEVLRTHSGRQDIDHMFQIMLTLSDVCIMYLSGRRQASSMVDIKFLGK